jgi:hypothetical protein
MGLKAKPISRLGDQGLVKGGKLFGGSAAGDRDNPSRLVVDADAQRRDSYDSAWPDPPRLMFDEARVRDMGGERQAMGLRMFDETTPASEPIFAKIATLQETINTYPKSV